MTIYVNYFVADASKFAAYQEQIDHVLNFKKKDGKPSGWVKFLEDHDIVIAPAEENVGVAIKEFKDLPLSTIASDTRTCNDIPGTFFAKNTTLNDMKYDKHIVYLNVHANADSYTSMNYFAHELGHAIDHALASGTNKHYSDSAEFKALYDANRDLFNATELSPLLKEYMGLTNEFFAEAFAFYRTKDKELKDCECFDRFFGTTLPADKAQQTPHEYLKTNHPDISSMFKNFYKPKKQD